MPKLASGIVGSQHRHLLPNACLTLRMLAARGRPVFLAGPRADIRHISYEMSALNSAVSRSIINFRVVNRIQLTMAISDYEVQPLFAVPYFMANIGHAISDEQVQYIKNIKNRDNLISEDLYVFDDPNLNSIKETVQEALDVYATEVMGLDQRLYVTQSWSLINNPNVGMHTHSHSNSIISGSLYYCDLPSPVSNMIFDRHVTYQQLALNPARDKQNIYNTPINVVTPKKNHLILFPSGLQHAVEMNTSSLPRYSIAFNCFVKGTLGDYRDVSELKLGVA